MKKCNIDTEKLASAVIKKFGTNVNYVNMIMGLSYFEDADTIKAIIEGLKKMEEEDLIKKACTGWLCAQFEAIVKSHEPQVEQETE